MSSPSIQFHKIWIDQCEAAEGIRERFGLQSALDYIIGEKLFPFVAAAETDNDFAGELPEFLAEIRRLFTPTEIQEYLDLLEKTKFFAPQEPELEEGDDFEDLDEDEPFLSHPVSAAEELLRYFRIRQLVQSS